MSGAVKPGSLLLTFPVIPRIPYWPTSKVRKSQKNCRCATGEGHVSYYLSSLDKNRRTRLDYVPLAWVPLVRERLDKQRRIQEIMAELAEINLELMRRREKD